MDNKSIHNHVYIIADNEEEARAKFLDRKPKDASAYEILEIKPVYKVVYVLKEGGEN